MKKVLKRENNISEIRDFVEMKLVGNCTYNVLFDKRDNTFNFTKSKTDKDYYINIGKVKVEDIDNDSLSDYKLKTNINKTATALNKLIQSYNKSGCLVCYTTVVKEYGKKNVIEKAFVKEVDNPYYKSSSAMKLYDKNVIEYNLKEV